MDKTKPEVTIPDGTYDGKQVGIEDLDVGDGAEATAGSQVDVHYVGVSWSTKQQFDASWDRKLARGKAEPDFTIDLHGHSLNSAYDRLDRALAQAIASHARIILLITGHAPKGEGPVTRGKIRAAVGDWLSASHHAPHIAAVRGAHPRHGGRGALYIVLRRRASAS